MPLQSGQKPILTALIVACALFMEQLDGTVISTALPAMAESLKASPIQLSLAITAYMFSLAVFIPVSGWAADRYGAKTVFRSAIVIFSVSSILCGFSQSLLELTAARVLQGFGGAMMVPVGRLVLLRSVPKSELVRAMAYLMVPALIGPVLGPPIGGFITTYASWRWIFFLNLPIGLLGFVLVSIFIENTREEMVKPLDRWGFLLTGVSVCCVVTSFELIGRETAGLGDWVLLATGCIVGIFAIHHARHHPHPLLDLSLFRVPTFSVSVSGGSFVRIGVGAFPFLLPLMLQIGFGMSAFSSGLLTFSAALGAMAMKASAGPVLRWFGFRSVLIVNGIISAVSIAICALFGGATPYALMFVVLLIGGFFRSLQFTSLNTVAYADLPASKMSAATSLYSMVQQVCLGAGVAVGALVLHLAQAWQGTGTGSLTLADFRVAFAVVGGISLLGVPFFWGLADDAGAEVSLHRHRR